MILHIRDWAPLSYQLKFLYQPGRNSTWSQSGLPWGLTPRPSPRPECRLVAQLLPETERRLIVVIETDSLIGYWEIPQMKCQSEVCLGFNRRSAETTALYLVDIVNELIQLSEPCMRILILEICSHSPHDMICPSYICLGSVKSQSQLPNGNHCKWNRLPF